MGSSEEERVVPSVPEPLKIFGKEFRRTTETILEVSCGLLGFTLSQLNNGCWYASINGRPLINPEVGIPILFLNEHHAIDTLESEGRHIAREMLTMAGEMVAVKPIGIVGIQGELVEQIPIVFKERDP